MDPLKDWYRYLDEVSRPIRSNGEEAQEPEWRPWLPTDEGEPLADAVAIEALPELPLAVRPGTYLDPTPPAPPVFQDLTVDDELPPTPRFSVPELRAPSFEVAIPRLTPQPVAAAAAPVPAAAAAGDVPSRSVAVAPRPVNRAAVPAEPPPGPAPLSVDREEPSDPDLPEDEEGSPGEGRAPGTMAPRYRELLSQIRSHDVAQNSYKAPFRETREELVQRLLDPPLTLEETARLLGVCPTTIRRYTNKGMLRHFRTSGNQRRFRLSDVLEFLETRFLEIEADQKVDQQTEEFKRNEARQG